MSRYSQNILVSFILACVLLAAAAPAAARNYVPTMDLLINGTRVGGVGYLLKDDGIIVDAKALLEHVAGAEYYTAAGGTGFAVQYGGEISFVAENHDSGFASCEEVTLDYHLEQVDDMLLAPLNFLASSVNAAMKFYPQDREIRVEIANSPSQVGDNIPQAKTLSKELSNEFTVRQGEISLANAIDFFATGYLPDCNGNNAGFPYLTIQSPPSPRKDSYNLIPVTFQMDQDEAFVAIGYTPPETTYYSYRSYLVNRYYEDTQTRDKIYASLGDTINNYNLAQTLGTEDVYGRFFMIISTGNQTVYEQIKQSAMDAGIAESDIFLDIVPADMIEFGMTETADSLNFLHRASLFSDEDAKSAYLANPTLEVLRVTPKQAIAESPLDQAPLRTRGTGVSEQDMDSRLAGTMEELYQAILDKHGSGKTATRLDTSVWLEEGNQAIAERKNVLGETRDTLYTKTDSFQFFEDDLIVVFGVNHTKTTKSVYSNMSCYGADHFNGFGGITNLLYEGTALEYLPDLDPDLAEKFYVWKFARSDPGDGTTYVVSQDVNHDYTGINYGDEVFMGFRSYIEKQTLVGTIIDEIVRDQAVLFR